MAVPGAGLLLDNDLIRNSLGLLLSFPAGLLSDKLLRTCSLLCLSYGSSTQPYHYIYIQILEDRC